MFVVPMFVAPIMVLVEYIESWLVMVELSIDRLVSVVDVLRSHPASNAAKASVIMIFFIIYSFLQRAKARFAFDPCFKQ